MMAEMTPIVGYGDNSSMLMRSAISSTPRRAASSRGFPWPLSKPRIREATAMFDEAVTQRPTCKKGSCRPPPFGR